MKTLKNRIVVAVALVMMMVASVVPAMAYSENTDGNPSPVNGNGVVYINASPASGMMSMMTVPVRCGNNC